MFASQSVRGHLENVFKQRDGPTYHNYPHQGLAFVPQVAVPRNGHE
jgi:hypothetical protein